MRNILLAAAAVMVAGSGAAMAAGTTNVQITASQVATCEIVAVSTTLALTTVDASVPGNFQYKCNFDGQPTISFASANGGVKNGAYTSKYGIYLNDAAPVSPPSAWLQSNLTPQSYNNITNSTPPNTIITPSFAVGLTEPLAVAGNYTDQLTISITP